MTLDDELRLRRLRLSADGLWRDPRPSPGLGVDLCTNDYLGLAGLGDALAGDAGGTVLGDVWPPAPLGAGASRLVEGDHAAHRAAEAALATWVGTPAALLFSSGYAANVGTLAALAGPGDRIVSDALNHASIIDGCRLSRAEVVVTPHLDLAAVDRALAQPRAGVALVVTESLFSMDGDGPDLRSLRALCDRHGAALIVDEAHALGVLGPAGAGRCAEAGVVPDALVGTLGKALGLHGAFVAGSEELRAWLWNRARSFVFSTGVAPRLAQVAAARIPRVAAAEDDRRRLVALRAALLEALHAAGLSTLGGLLGPIVPVPFPTGAEALEAADRARAEGFRVVAIRPPTVPTGGPRLRLTLRPGLDPEAFPRLASALRGAALAGGLAPSRRREAPAAVPALSAESPSAAGVATRSGGEPGRARESRGITPAARQDGDRDRAPGPDRAEVGGAMPGVVPLRQRRVALVGTGTGVGKTELGVALLRALGRRLPNLPTAGVKLLETGVAPGASGSDGARLSGAGRTAIGEALVTFPDPLSPHLAARLAGRALTARELAEALDRALRRTWTAARPRQSDTTSDAALLVVIETAGGLFSPISERETNEDLAALVDPSLLILVASDRLGVLHEVAACRRALRSSLQPLLAVVLNRPAQPDQSTGTNAQELERLGLGPVLGVLPEVEGADPAALDAALARLVDAVVG